MNILFIERAFTPTLGGVERVTYTLGESLRKRGHVVYYAFEKCDKNDLAFDFKLIYESGWYLAKLKEFFVDFITKHSVQVLICQNVHTPKFQEIYSYVKAKTGVRIITCLHCNPDIWMNKNRIGQTTTKVYVKELIRSLYYSLWRNPWKEKMKGMYDLTDKYVLLSNGFKGTFSEICHVGGNKLEVIPNPCAFSKERKVSDKENMVLVVARMAEQQKRISCVLKIWSQVYDKIPTWKMILVGDGPDLNLYKDMARNLSLERYEFVGTQQHPEIYYQKAKIFLMTSIWEGLPMTLIEAQHYGCVPIVYDSYAAVHDIVSDGENGYIIPLHKQNEFVQRLEQLMNNETRIKIMSEKAMTSSSDKFDIDVVTDKWEQLIKMN